MAAPKNNRFAAKPIGERFGEVLYVRLRKGDKQRIIAAAGAAGIAEWTRGVLLAAANDIDSGRANKALQ